MSYTINLTNGNVFATIADGTINTSAYVGGTTPLTLVGKNYAGYGQFLDDNFIHLLENGASSTQPTSPLTGQIWYNTTTGLLSVYGGSSKGFKPLAVLTAAANDAAPTNNNIGDLWYDSVNQQLNIYSGTGNSGFTLIGPAYSANIGLTGAIAANIVDNGGAGHPVVELFAGSTLVGIISRDANTWTPQTAISGFDTVSPGIQLSSTISNCAFQGIATNSEQLNGLVYTQFMRSDAPATNSTSISVNTGGATSTVIINGSGLSGVGNIATPSTPFNTIFTTAASLNNIINSGTSGTGNVGSAAKPFDTIFANTTSITNTATNNIINSGTSGTGNVGSTALPFNTIFATSANVNNIVNSGTSGTGNVGSAAKPFNTIFATATSAQYADLAERFAADEVYEAGTVVELGGSAEVTRVTAELSDTVFGVISTRAAYLMNGGAGTDATHPPVAMTGRVPVKVVGSVRKGDRLVSAGNGIARAAQPGEATAFNVIGRALVSKLDTGLGTVEAIVTIK